jgi:hypothetical protein
MIEQSCADYEAVCTGNKPAIAEAGLELIEDERADNLLLRKAFEQTGRSVGKLDEIIDHFALCNSNGARRR